jgi:hypothetical protein
MLKSKQSDTSVKLILTLTELQTTSAPNYYFVFTHVLTKQAVAFTLANAQDESLYKSRYNRFTINPSSVFANKPTGEWHYKVYENDANGVLLEQGKMILESATDFSYSKYESDSSFKTYNG